nr:unnamed protein product [Callosobruchus chinensis]
MISLEKLRMKSNSQSPLKRKSCCSIPFY